MADVDYLERSKPVLNNQIYWRDQSSYGSIIWKRLIHGFLRGETVDS